MKETDFSDIIKRVFITMPFGRIDDAMLSLVERHRLNLEVGIHHYALDHLPRERFRETAGKLADLGIAMTVHAPFQELFLGAPDALVRGAAAARLDAAFEVIPFFSPRTVVMHLNYEERRFGFVHRQWLDYIIPALERYAQRCGEMGAMLVLENVYEENPAAMVEVFEKLADYGVHHCFDAGHLNAFSETGLEDWLAQAGPYIRQFHLHDNDGSADQHAPLGSGRIRFDVIKKFISGMERPPVITLEAHSEPDIWKTLEGFRRLEFMEVVR